MEGLYLIYYRPELFLLCLVNNIRVILPYRRPVWRYYHHIKLIYLVELLRLCLRSTGHAGEFFIHPEIVLKCDGCKCLVLVLNLYTFLCLKGLMETIAVTSFFFQAEDGIRNGTVTGVQTCALPI